MTRKEVYAAYDVNTNGIITSLGKFESEPAYVPFFWFNDDLSSDDDLGNIQGYIVTAEDRAEWPELGTTAALILEESDQGFVYSEEFESLDSYHAKIMELEAGETDEF